jgi:CubicO group peptidase (beta-lactamase class C family)
MRLAPAIAVVAAIASTPLFGSETASDLIGLWRGGISAAQIRGELSVDGRKPTWRASIRSATRGQDSTANVKRDSDKIAFDLTVGKFRGVVEGNRIVGHWIQPPNEINRNNSYATPVELNQIRSKLWRGSISSMPAQLTFWLSIQHTADGALTAVIRNPELNLFRRKVYRVEQDGDHVTFVNTNDTDEKFDAKLIRTGQARVLENIRLPNLVAPVEFHTAFRPGEARGFLPSLEGCDAYLYAKPRAEDDGWVTASLSDVGLNEKPIAELVGKICQVDPLDNPFPIHSLLIVRHGKLVLEEYFYGFERDQAHDMRSASKTFAPLLIGIARERGAKIDINTPVLSLFPEYKEIANPDPRKSKITLRDLMTMTSGFDCDDNDESSPGQEDKMYEQKAQPDWYKYTLDLPMARDPGGNQAVYCSAGINLLGGIIRNATRNWLPEFFYENVARSLQIKTYHWNLMPNGDGYAGGGVRMRPRDQLKLGQLYLNGGVWNGRRVISKDWVDRSTSAESRFEPIFGVDHEYGYAWHIHHLKSGDHTYRVYAAEGNGGQLVIVVPDLDMVVGFTGGAYGEFSKWIKWEIELTPQFIIPAATSTGTH